MKKNYFLLLLFLFSIAGFSQVVNIPDPYFRDALTMGLSNLNAIAKDGNGNTVAIDANSNGSIEVAEAQNIHYLHIYTNYTYSNTIQSLIGIEAFSNLRYFSIDTHNIPTVNLSMLTYLEELHLSQNKIINLNVTGLSNLQILDCSGSNELGNLANLDLTGLTNLRELTCNNNLLLALDVSQLSTLEVLNCMYNELSTLNLSGLTNLVEVNCSYNNLNSLNLTGLNNLELLHCYSNNLTEINLSELPAIEQFSCGANQLSVLDLSANVNLKSMECTNNLLSDLQVTQLPELQYLYCSNNPLGILDVSGLANLLEIRSEYCELTSLNLAGCESLYELRCAHNLMVSLDMSDCKNSYILDCSYNNLESMFLKNGAGNTYYTYFYDNYNLQYICADDFEISYLYGIMYQYAQYPDPETVNINSYCSFTPGGSFYTIGGTQTLDVDQNGCDAADDAFPTLNFLVTDGFNTGNFISNDSGIYSMSLSEGTHTITPILENPEYFSVSPTSIAVSFPVDVSPYEQSFCIVPNGNHIDVEITLLPIAAARPGFDADYKIIYKNKGTTVQSGEVTLTFPDLFIDFVLATPSVISQSVNTLMWNYTNLRPFETREIDVTFNINSPMETPAVNAGDQLDFSALVSPQIGDEMPLDNGSGLKQIVVNSFDPNDKTCVEGTTIIPEMIGEYVHYVIRFENTGTFAAQNIVVKDMIDLTKFEIATLIPISGSHPFETRISGNKVEFIFENIMLPFDDDNNDGYVAFRIKTLPNLAVGDTFTNSASIYFDYNFPIITNDAVTTIQVLGKSDFSFSDYFVIYPNPASGVLNIKANHSVNINSISVYNMLGQVVLVIPNAQTLSSIDVSHLKTGSYFLKINSDKGATIGKFVKS